MRMRYLSKIYEEMRKDLPPVVAELQVPLKSQLVYLSLGVIDVSTILYPKFPLVDQYSTSIHPSRTSSGVLVIIFFSSR